MTNNNHMLINCAELEFDLALGTVKNASGETQRLSPINLKLLAYLLGHQGKVIGRAELFDAIWPNQIVSDDVLTRAVSDVRTQLAKLDASIKFIETLPKRGYRWAVEANEVAISSPSVLSELVTPLLPERRPQSYARATHPIINVLLTLGSALLLAGVIMWGIGQSIANQISIAVMPVSVDRPQLNAAAHFVDDSLMRILRKNPHLKILSKSAVDSRPQNPFPYFFSEFGARWVIESRVSDLDGINQVTLNLVDARTGVELRSASFDMTSHVEFSAKLARQLETYWLVDEVNY